MALNNISYIYIHIYVYNGGIPLVVHRWPVWLEMLACEFKQTPRPKRNHQPRTQHPHIPEGGGWNIARTSHKHTHTHTIFTLEIKYPGWLLTGGSNDIVFSTPRGILLYKWHWNSISKNRGAISRPPRAHSLAHLVHRKNTSCWERKRARLSPAILFVFAKRKELLSRLN